jgi:hypothetical protein
VMNDTIFGIWGQDDELWSHDMGQSGVVLQTGEELDRRATRDEPISASREPCSHSGKRHNHRRGRRGERDAAR